MNNAHLLEFASDLLQVSEKHVVLDAVTGGDINECYRASTALGKPVFIKANHQSDILRSEFDSLNALHALGARAYPAVIDYRQVDGGGLLALSYHQLCPLAHNHRAAALAATLLYQQHGIKSQQYGWLHDNYIGRSQQRNQFSTDWLEFFASQRLQPQLRWAADAGLAASFVAKIESVMATLSVHIDSGDVQPSLLHGDLWSGNVAFCSLLKSPILYDPAPYYGDPEVDIAMTRLFGGFPNEFYAQYRSHMPQPEDEVTRSAVYNLYHALNHVNLFGLNYQSLVESSLRALV